MTGVGVLINIFSSTSPSSEVFLGSDEKFCVEVQVYRDAHKEEKWRYPHEERSESHRHKTHDAHEERFVHRGADEPPEKPEKAEGDDEGGKPPYRACPEGGATCFNEARMLHIFLLMSG